MFVEIERKFLVRSEAFKALATHHYTIAQGYISRDPGRTVRIRMKDNQGYLTIKATSSESGLTRLEWEKAINKQDFDLLWPLCLPGSILKTRFEIPYHNHTIEVDVFHHENTGLILAEIELKNENDLVYLPDWLGEEVTGDERYYNSYLSAHPYSTWATPIE